MAIKFTARDRPKDAPVAAKAQPEKTAREPVAVAKDEASAGGDLFNTDAKASKRKQK